MRRDATRGAGFSLTIETLAVHAGQGAGRAHGGRLAPDLPDVDVPPGWRGPADDYDYARTKNPTRTFERAVAALEGGVAFAPGSATTAAIAGACRRGLGDRGRRRRLRRTFRYLEKVRRRMASCPATQTSPRTPRRCGRHSSEDPPRLVRDADESAAQGRRHRRHRRGPARTLRGRPRPLVVVDSTFATPVLQRPLDLARTSSSTRRRNTSRATATRSLASP